MGAAQKKGGSTFSCPSGGGVTTAHEACDPDDSCLSNVEISAQSCSSNVLDAAHSCGRSAHVTMSHVDDPCLYNAWTCGQMCMSKAVDPSPRVPHPSMLQLALGPQDHQRNVFFEEVRGVPFSTPSQASDYGSVDTALNTLQSAKKIRRVG